jgi:hypothetical protein
MLDSIDLRSVLGFCCGRASVGALTLKYRSQQAAQPQLPIWDHFWRRNGMLLGAAPLQRTA